MASIIPSLVSHVSQCQHCSKAYSIRLLGDRVYIMVVLIGLVAVFKTQINELLTKIFSSITTMSNDIL